MYRQLSRSLFAPILATILISSCGLMDQLMKGKAIAENAVVEFHNRLNAQQCNEIYEQADNRFKQKHGKNDAINACKTIYKQFGQVKSSSLLGYNINSNPTKTLATLKYTTKFSQVTISEEFVFVIEGDRARIVEYSLIQ